MEDLFASIIKFSNKLKLFSKIIKKTNAPKLSLILLLSDSSEAVRPKFH